MTRFVLGLVQGPPGCLRFSFTRRQAGEIAKIPLPCQNPPAAWFAPSGLHGGIDAEVG
jgi:hypothetical protein